MKERVYCSYCGQFIYEFGKQYAESETHECISINAIYSMCKEILSILKR